MGSKDLTADGGPAAAGGGRLAELISTRGGLASPEAPFVIEHREALIYMLCEAAELEHGIMCQYLFAVFSLKQSAAEGLSDAEAAAVTRWRKLISQVATQEMLHLALVHNLLSAIGSAPHLSRPNLPQPAGHYPAGVQLALLPFGEQALRHFMYLERPEGMDLQDAEGLAAAGRAVPLLTERDIVPQAQDFATVGHLYRSVEQGFWHLAAKYGERWLFAGPPRAQATEAYFRWPELIAVTGLSTAQRAIDTILEQGEGPRGEWRDAHFGKFVSILDEYQQLRAANPQFDPVRPVMAANVRSCQGDIAVPLITDPVTARVTDLFNVSYEILLQIFERYFAHTRETDAQLGVLADATVTLMAGVLRPLGDLITTLPAGPDYPARTAGPSFELFYENDYLMPHQHAAWALLTERLDEAAWLCQELRQGRGSRLAGQLAPVLAALTGVAASLAAHLPADLARARPLPVTAGPGAAELDRLLARSAELADGVRAAAGGSELAAELAGVFGVAHSAARAAAAAPADRQLFGVVARLVDSVLRPLAGGLSRLASGQGAAAQADRGRPARDQAQSPGGGQPAGGGPDGVSGRGVAPAEPGARVAEQVWAAARQATVLRLRLADEEPAAAAAGSAAASAALPELAEATAALQGLACQLAPPGLRGSRLAELWALHGDRPPVIEVADNGPYLVTSVPRLRDHLGAAIGEAPQPAPASQPTATPQTAPDPQPAPDPPPALTPQLGLTPQLALCRCGGSALKPYCDGSHARNGFTGGKDADRVPDRRDAYPGQQVTIFDNRGICQHSGLCTDRLATVFRAAREPFVAASGGRMDEIIRAVRDCPSGALSFALDGREAREQADWGNSREPAIEVTQDGPYRVTGGIAVTEPGGGAVARAAGSSAEHCALCRCGHSQNKPFCSGMHWYVGFSDPVAAPGAEPALFAWAGGMPALTRMTRLLYEKHVPGDALLAAAFADMAADQPEVEALWLGEAFGGPGRPGSDDSRGQRGTPGPAGRPLTAQQRARWVALAGQAADEAGLPGDPAFRSALTGLLEWVSRLDANAGAAAGPPDSAGAAAPGAAAPGNGAAADVPVPRWGWGPAGAPDTSAAVAADQAAAAPPLPGPDEPVSFASHIRPLFRDRDRQSMTFAFDLWSADDVRAHASAILEQVDSGKMPCDSRWDAGQVAVFRRWAESGMPA